MSYLSNPIPKTSFVGDVGRLPPVRYSGIHFTVLDQIIAGDRVASRLQATGVERATGKPVRLYGMNISLIRAGKIVAEWPVWELIRSEDQ